MTDEHGYIHIGHHPVDNKESFSEAIDCLSHAMEEVDGIQSEVEDEGIKNALTALHEKIYTSILLGEFIEKIMFNKKENKKDPDNKVLCCPFHKELTPSCVVSMNSLQYYCFGCGAKGDVKPFQALFEKALGVSLDLRYLKDIQNEK